MHPGERTELKDEIKNLTITVGAFNISLYIMGRTKKRLTRKQKTSITL